MRGTKPIEITTPKLVSSTVAEPYVPAAYAGGTTYAYGAIISVAADFSIYESLQAANTGNTPSTSPLWWRKIGPTETAYNSGTTYGVGDTVSLASSHRCYESLQAGNTNKPLPVLPETTTDWWLDIGPTMRYAMFDLSRNTQTVGPSPLTAVVAPGQRLNTAGLTGMSGNTLTIKATSASAGGTIYPLAYSASKTYAKFECMTVGLTTCYQSKADGNVGNPAPDSDWWEVVSGAVFDLNIRDVFDAYTYCFEPFQTRPTKAVFDIPPVSDVVVTVTLEADSGNCKIGGETLGTNVYLGVLQKDGATNRGRGFSSVTRDKYGNATLVKRRMLPTLAGTLRLPSRLIDQALRARDDFDAEPVLYTGLDEDGDWTNAVTILGVHQQFEIGTTQSIDAEIKFMAEEI
jgi:hypothetical protein